ncbi:Flavodoxin 1 [Buchnera aphidicola (Tetraneura ulmi)]|uniref:flavodoxin FldA n=1 Tax=Buchnera aphidicola TaxID=9 RepID=UPI003463BB8E
MKKIGIFYGSDTGNTEFVANQIKECFQKKNIIINDISNCTKQDLEKFSILIIGSPTWYYGEIQSDWEDFLPILKTINFKNKKIALFGCGDQEDYSEYFCDAIGILYNIFREKEAIMIGKWENKGYSFDSSKALLNKKYFCGMTIDEDRQAKKTKNRIQKWVNQINLEIHSI